jgi:hypothetical protein
VRQRQVGGVDRDQPCQAAVEREVLDRPAATLAGPVLCKNTEIGAGPSIPASASTRASRTVSSPAVLRMAFACWLTSCVSWRWCSAHAELAAENLFL